MIVARSFESGDCVLCGSLDLETLIKRCGVNICVWVIIGRGFCLSLSQGIQSCGEVVVERREVTSKPEKVNVVSNKKNVNVRVRTST